MISAYRKDGVIQYTAIVREVLKADGTKSTTYCNYGTPTLVESKWGPMGRYIHPPEVVPDSYLPKDNPNTQENERTAGITYYQPPDREPPKNTGDPGKDIHRLKED